MTTHQFSENLTGRDARDYVEEGAAFLAMVGSGSAVAAKRQPAAREPVTLAPKPQRVDVVVIGGGQAGLSVGYHLKRHKVSVRDPRSQRADRRCLAPALGLAAPVHAGPLRRPRRHAVSGARPTPFRPRTRWPTTSRPTRCGSRCRCAPASRVERVERKGDRYLVRAGDQRFEAAHVVVAMANYQAPRVPDFAGDLDPDIVQLHSSAYRSPAQLRPGAVLIVGRRKFGRRDRARSLPAAATARGCRDAIPATFPSASSGFLGRNFARPSGAEGAVPPDLHAEHADRAQGRARSHRAWRAADPRQARGTSPPRASSASAGSRRAATDAPCSMTGACWTSPTSSGAPASTPAISWIDLPVFDEDGEPVHERGVVTGEPGLYFVGLHFLYAVSSTMIHGVGRDARYVADKIGARLRSEARQAA